MLHLAVMDWYGVNTAAVCENVVGASHAEEPPSMGAEQFDDFAVSQLARH
jgi:hypothetical protein